MRGQTLERCLLGRVIFSLAAILAMVVGSTVGHAAMSDYERQQVTQYLHSPKTDMDAGIFDGTAFNPSVSVDGAASYMNDYIKTLNKAVQAFNKLTSGARSYHRSLC